MSRYSTADSIVGLDDTFLHDVALEVDERLLPIDDVFQKMIDFAQSVDEGVVGLAANQVGWPFRIIIVMMDPDNWDPTTDGAPIWYKAINPKALKTQGAFILDEGCLSYRGRKPVKCRRPWRVLVEFTTPKGKRIQHWAEGLEAAAWSHEIGHLNGVTIYDGLEE